MEVERYENESTSTNDCNSLMNYTEYDEFNQIIIHHLQIIIQ